ncbi:MAG: ribosome maturation factor RimP [Longimicrobiales bacterium]
MSEDRLEHDLEAQIELLGYELVELERVGTKTRPILRIRVDRPGAKPGAGVTVEECAKVSRALEAYLDVAEGLSEKYLLEVSSPGVERPLRRRAEFERFVGWPVSVKLHRKMETHGKRIEGDLCGVSGEGSDESIRLRLQDGTEVSVPRAEIARANLVFRWDKKG